MRLSRKLQVTIPCCSSKDELDTRSRDVCRTRSRHIAILCTLRVPANPPRTYESVYYEITVVIQTVTHIMIFNTVYITCISISWPDLGQGLKPKPRFWRGLWLRASGILILQTRQTKELLQRGSLGAMLRREV